MLIVELLLVAADFIKNIQFLIRLKTKFIEPILKTQKCTGGFRLAGASFLMNIISSYYI